MVRVIKILHTLSAIGLMGGVAAFVVLRSAGPTPDDAAWPALCHALVVLHARLIVPSMLLCLFSGLASMIAHRPYWNALWAWLKALSGLAALELTFRLQGLSTSLSTETNLTDLTTGLRLESSSCWVLLTVAFFNVVVGIVRPKFGLRPA
jgi:hypothetical protein